MKFISTLPVGCLAIVALMIAPAQAIVIGTNSGNGADTWINGGASSGTNYGGSGYFLCRRASGDYTRKGYVRFDLGGPGIHADNVTLKLYVHSVSSQALDTPTPMNVWGLNDAVSGVDNSSPADGDFVDDEDTHDEFWPEMVMDWTSDPAYGTDTSPNLAVATLLGTFSVPYQATQNTEITFSDPNLLAMIQNDTNGVISLIMQPNGVADYIYFRSKEGSTTYQPVLEFSAAVLTWDGGGAAEKNWTQPTNWNPDGMPIESATFNDTATAALGTVTSIVNETYLVGELNFEHLDTSSTGYHTMEIAAGATLTVNGNLGVSAANAVTFGNTTADGSNRTVITGDGTLAVNSPTKDFLVTGRNHATGVGKSTVALDMSGLANFEATVNEFRVLTGYLHSQATVTLARNNTITADAVVLSSNNGIPYTDLVQLGQTNTINTTKLIVAGARSVATLEFDPDLSGTPSITIRGKAGGESRANVWIADQGGNGGYGLGGSSHARGTVDLTGATVDARLGTLIVGRNGSVATYQPGAATGVLSFDAGTIDADTIYLGLTPALADTNLSGYDVPDEGHTRGTLNMGGGTLTVGTMNLGEVQGHEAPVAGGKPLSTRATGTFNLLGGTATVGNITLGHHTSTGPSEGTGIINVTGGTLNVTGNLVEGTGGATSISTVNLQDGTLSVGGNLIVDTFDFTGGTLHVGTIGFTLDQDGGILAPGSSVGTTTIQGDYNMNDGFLEIELDSSTSYDQLIVEGDVNLAGELSLVLNFEPADFHDFTILDNQGTGAIASTFNGLAEGDEVLASYNGLGQTFLISYLGGDGNDIVLSNVPEPAGLLLLALGSLCLLAWRRV